MPWIIASQTMPILAIAPMIIVVLGSMGFVGLVPKAIISAYLCFFPVTIGMVKGLTSPDPLHLDLDAHLQRHRPGQIFWKLRWPSRSSILFASLKVAVALSIVGAIVGELPTGAQAGLGARLLSGSYYGQTVQIWAALVVAAFVAGLSVAAVGLAERLDARAHGRPAMRRLDWILVLALRPRPRSARAAARRRRLDHRAACPLAAGAGLRRHAPVLPLSAPGRAERARLVRRPRARRQHRRRRRALSSCSWPAPLAIAASGLWLGLLALALLVWRALERGAALAAGTATALLDLAGAAAVRDLAALSLAGLVEGFQIPLVLLPPPDARSPRCWSPRCRCCGQISCRPSSNRCPGLRHRLRRRLPRRRADRPRARSCSAGCCRSAIS